MDDWLTCFLSGMWRFEYGFKFSTEGYKRYFREYLPLLHKTQHEVLGHHDDQSWYLVYIGTKPEARGKGYARALIESVTKEVRCSECCLHRLSEASLKGFPRDHHTLVA